MFGTVLIILIAGAVAILAAMRFIAAVRKLTSREPDTRNTRTLAGHLHNSMGLTPLNQGHNTRTPSGHSHNYSELALRSQGNNTRNTRNTPIPTTGNPARVNGVVEKKVSQKSWRFWTVPNIFP